MNQPLPCDPILARGATLAQDAEARDKRLAQLERDLLATLPADSLAILAQAFSVRHGRQGHHLWSSWIGKNLPCPVSDLQIDQLHRQTLDAAGER